MATPRTFERATYRNFHIYYDPPPIPIRSMDWGFYHDDYDGAPDSNDCRHGNGASYEDCCEQIDILYEEEPELFT